MLPYQIAPGNVSEDACHASRISACWLLATLLEHLIFGGDLMPFDPPISAKVSRYKCEPYRETSGWCTYHSQPRRWHTLQRYRNRNGRCVVICYKRSRSGVNVTLLCYGLKPENFTEDRMRTLKDIAGGAKTKVILEPFQATFE